MMGVLFGRDAIKIVGENKKNKEILFLLLIDSISLISNLPEIYQSLTYDLRSSAVPF